VEHRKCAVIQARRVGGKSSPEDCKEGIKVATFMLRQAQPLYQN